MGFRNRPCFDKIVSNLSKKDIDKLSNIFTNEVAPILGKLQKN